MKMKKADQVSWAVDDVSRWRKAVKCKTSIGDSGGEGNLGEAQAYCPRGKVNKMMEASSFDVREGTPPGTMDPVTS
jgi:hypothetical protein